MLDSSSPFYIAPRPSPALARWLWLFRAACSRERARGGRSRAARAARGERAPARRARRRARRDSGCSTTTASCRCSRRAAGLAAAREDVERARALGARIDEVTAAEARRLFPGLRCELAGAFFFPEDGHLDPMRFTRAVAGLAEEAGATVMTGAEVLAARAGARRRARRHHARRVRGRPGGAGGRRLDAAAHPRARPAAARSSRPRATASTWSGRRTSPSCRCTWATPTSSSRRSATRCASAARWSCPAGTCACAPGGWRYLREGGRRAIGLPADGPVRQLWRGPRPVTPDGLPVIGRVPGRDRVILATGHCMLGLSLGPVTGTPGRRSSRRRGAVDRPGAALCTASLA